MFLPRTVLPILALFAGPLHAQGNLDVTIPSLPAGKQVQIVYTTTVNGTPTGINADGTFEISQQATIAATGQSNTVTDDPAEPGATDATIVDGFVNTPPTVFGGSTPSVTSAGATVYSFRIDYRDDGVFTVVDADSIDANDVVVTGPNGPVPVTSGTASGPDAALLSGSYTLTPPGGSWDPSDNGTYTISLVGNQVFDQPLSGMEPSLAAVAVPTLSTFDVEILTPPGFAKNFAPDVIGEDGISTLTFTIDNTANPVAATSVDFTDNLPSGVVIATPANASTTCVGGTLTAVSETGTVSYTGGTVPAGTSCTVTVDVTSSTPGSYLNTSGDLTSSIGNSGPASDTLTVAPPPLFSKEFSPASIAFGGTSTLTFTIDNSLSPLDATAIDFTDNLPAGMTVATPANASTTCTGGTLTATSGTGVISYTGGSVAAGASCTVTVDVTAMALGDLVNTSGDLTSSRGNSGTATDTLSVVDNTPPAITCPPGITVECDQPTDPSATGFATAIDDLDPNPVLGFADSTIPGSNADNFTIVRTWTAMDASGNQSSCQQTITVQDTTAPVITCPAGITIECDDSEDPSNTGSATATDNCDPNPAITFSDNITAGSNAYNFTITRTWTATDATGNASSCDQTITVQDTTAPAITCPADTTIECDESEAPANTGSATAIDGCDPNPTITFSDNITAGSNAYNFTITRTWTATDATGNASSCDQTITVQDTTAPVITCPADTMIECDESEDPSNTGTATATDACDPDPAITFSDNITAGSNAYNFTITRTWTATDASGNSSNCTQTITVQDTTDPVVVCPPDVSVLSTEPTTPADTGFATATDTCDPNPVVTFSDATAPAPNGVDSILTRTWRGTDASGNEGSCQQVITILAGLDLVVTAAESVDPVTAGNVPLPNLTHEFTVTNNGPIEATNIVLSLSFTETTGISASGITPESGTVTDQGPGAAQWTIPTLAIGASVTLEVDYGVDAAATAAVDAVSSTLTAQSLDQPQINTGDESATVATSVVREVDIVPSIEVLQDPLVAGGDALETFRVLVTNNGPSDASGVAISLPGVLPADVSFTNFDTASGTVAGGTWTIGDLPAAGSASLIITAQAGSGASSGTDVIPLTAVVSSITESQSETSNDSASAATSIISAADTGTGITVAPTVNLQSGLFVSEVTVTNNNSEAIPAFRLYVKNLPADVEVHNATGSRTFGTPPSELPFVLHNQPLAASDSVTLSIEFFRASLDPGFTPQYEIELLPIPEPDPTAAPAGLAVARNERLPNGDQLIEIVSTPGSTYAVEYSADMTTWVRVVPAVTAVANRLQWIDNGPPKTVSHPSTVGSRFYRFVLITPPTPSSE
ncbi:IPTL-CTERM sorting domain-containing protein [Haloferula helveola]|uniref:IPTL-CTERM sorting domain-containing protein n=1 Tax=Haloferula helveola TaxID=490095 RepID=A0ABN6H7V1_9BACT|nr:IPTL-CTERM sorting domain-containing protein [Haloferula helveola]